MLNNIADHVFEFQNRERLVDTFISSIYVYDNKLVINYNCREDSEVILPDNMAASSYLTIVGEPHRTNPNHAEGSDFFVFYEGKAVFGLVVKL